MRRALYILSSIISLSTLSILLTIHNIGKAGNYIFALHDFIWGYALIFGFCTFFCIYKYFKAND